MKNLFLEDLSGLTQDKVKEYIACSYEYPLEQLEKYEILVAYESVGSWGCDNEKSNSQAVKDYIENLKV